MSEVLAWVGEETLEVAPYESFALDSTMGALVTFHGVVRDHDHGRSVSALDYRAHPDAERFLREACRKIASDTGCRVAAGHRVGSLQVGDTALVASVAAPHRAAAFAACADLVDLIKMTVPIWKKQYLDDGETEWVGL